MATCNDIVTKALQRLSIVGLGRVPTAAEATDGMFALQAIYDGWMQGEFFGSMTDVYATSDYEAGEFEKVFADGATITLPDTITDANGATRQPNDLAVIGVNATTWQYYIYDGAWFETTNLALTSTAPLASRGADGLAALLAMRIAETYGIAVPAVTVDRAHGFVSGLMRFPNIRHESALTNRYAWLPVW